MSVLLEEAGRMRTAHGAHSIPRPPPCPASTVGPAPQAEHCAWGQVCASRQEPGAAPGGGQAFSCFWPWGLRGSGEGWAFRSSGSLEVCARRGPGPGSLGPPFCWECRLWVPRAGPDPVSLPGPLGDLVVLGGSGASHRGSLSRTPPGLHAAEGMGLAGLPGSPSSACTSPHTSPAQRCNLTEKYSISR